MRALIVGFAVVLLATSQALRPAAADPLIERGRHIAEARCGRCHATGQTGASPHAIVLPFRTFAERYPIEMLTDALKSGVVGGHDEMPMFDLGPEDTRALLAHIDSLSPPAARYLSRP